MRESADTPTAPFRLRHQMLFAPVFPMETRPEIPELSIVIPVFNGAQTISGVVAEIYAERVLRDVPTLEIVLVNDGSSDHSEQVCTELLNQHPSITFVQLEGNFGEHSAVLAGLAHARGRHVCLMDDDGQNSPADAFRMLSFLKQHGHDVVYAQYPKRRHSMLRIAGSSFNDRVATLLLGKPAGLYLSSFKVMVRKIAMRLCESKDSRPYLDGLVLRATRNIGQVMAEHRPRRVGRSGYTLGKLIDLWLSMVLGAGISGLQIAAAAGAIGATVLVLLAAALFANRAMFSPQDSEAISQLAGVAAFVTAIQIVALGLLGLYLRNALLRRGESPAFVLRYVRYPEDCTAPNAGLEHRSRSVSESIAC